MPFGLCRQTITPSGVQITQLHQGEIIIAKYAARHWAVWIGAELVAVTVYKKGAVRVAELLQGLSSLEINESSKVSHTRSH